MHEALGSIPHERKGGEKGEERGGEGRGEEKKRQRQTDRQKETKKERKRKSEREKGQAQSPRPKAHYLGLSVARDMCGKDREEVGLDLS
jgi:hypothetical protein